MIWLILAAVTQGSQPDTTFAALARVAERGIRQGVYPGAVVVVGRRDTVLYASGFGHLTWTTSGSVPSPAETRWDLASLTKVVATTSAMLVLVDEGRVSLDAPVFRYLPRFRGGSRDRVTVRMLLDHTSGLPPYIPLFRITKTRQAALDALFKVRLQRAPGRGMEYSDLNAILLGLLVEQIAGMPLNRFAARAVFVPLGMKATAFAPELPRTASVAPSRRIGCCAAPGRVNDENAFFLGGVAGHAGLFSTGMDLARFAQTWLREGGGWGGGGGGGDGDEGQGSGSPWVSPESIRLFLNRPTGEGRALGWDVPGSGGESAGAGPSAFGVSICGCAFGHTGWTGTMLWADPASDVFVVFLTNRSLEPRMRNSIAAMRELRHELSERALEIVKHRGDW